MKLKTQLLIGYLVVFIMMIFVSGGTIYFLMNSGAKVAHTYDVIGDSHFINKLMVDMETGERGFLITGNKEFLEPYESGTKEYQTKIVHLMEQVSDNPAQVKQLETIDHLVDQWHEKAAVPVIGMRKKVTQSTVDAEYLQALLRKGIGKGILDEMREIIQDIAARFRIDGNHKGELLITHIAKAMVDRETGERGFLIAGDTSFLEPFLEGKDMHDQTFNGLNSFLADSHD